MTKTKQPVFLAVRPADEVVLTFDAGVRTATFEGAEEGVIIVGVTDEIVKALADQGRIAGVSMSLHIELKGE